MQYLTIFTCFSIFWVNWDGILIQAMIWALIFIAISAIFDLMLKISWLLLDSHILAKKWALIFCAICDFKSNKNFCQTTNDIGIVRNLNNWPLECQVDIKTTRPKQKFKRRIKIWLKQNLSSQFEIIFKTEFEPLKISDIDQKMSAHC